MAYVLINAEIGGEESLKESLNEIPQVTEVYEVYGVYDVIARIEVADIKELKDLISSKIRRIDGVRSTLTMIVMG